jgi:hypothetical protein
MLNIIRVMEDSREHFFRNVGSQANPAADEVRSPDTEDFDNARWAAIASTSLVLLAMALGVVWVYFPLDIFEGNQLLGMDYHTLHKYRIQFAQEALFEGEPHLPGWYPRELMGAPFWSNIQNFPFIPTRLILLLFRSDIAFLVGVNLAALLAALFTYLYCRSLRMARLSAAVAGWTFACSGYFASRVLAGHLPLLEAYPALPLLLWLAERAIQAENSGVNSQYWLLALGLSTLFVSLSGHPQLPIYAITAAVCYVLYRDFSLKAIKRVGVLFLGAASSAFCMWPMLILTSQSTRFLALDSPLNNIILPFSRLKAFVLPWFDGWPSAVKRFPAEPFSGYSTVAYFWDTVCYVGVFPFIALIALSVHALLQRRARKKIWYHPWPGLVTMGIASLVFALPPAQYVMEQIPGMILRSPSRQLYITVFTLSLVFGVFMDMLMKGRIFDRKGGIFQIPVDSLLLRTQRYTGLRQTNCSLLLTSHERSRKGTIFAWYLAIIGLCVHLVDVKTHDQYFIRVVPMEKWDDAFYKDVKALVGNHRISVDLAYVPSINRKIDDVGFFDSVMLGRSYSTLINLSGMAQGLNVQRLNGSQLNIHTLSYLGVKLLFTRSKYKGTTRYPLNAPVPVYKIPNPAPRAIFYPISSARYFDLDKIRTMMQDQNADVRSIIMLPTSAKPQNASDRALSHESTEFGTKVTYIRETSDRIICMIDVKQAGYLRILESWYEGWHARVNGEETEILLADGFAMAIYLEPGKHRVILDFYTPGKWLGMAVTAISLILMVMLIFKDRLTLAAASGKNKSHASLGTAAAKSNSAKVTL